MEFSVESLLESGFTKRELRYIYNNIYSFGGTLEEVVRDLSKRFKIFLWVFCCCITVFLFLLYSKSDDLGYVFWWWYIVTCRCSYNWVFSAANHFI